MATYLATRIFEIQGLLWWEKRGDEYLKRGKVIKNWNVLSSHQSKSSAQEVETREAK